MGNPFTSQPLKATPLPPGLSTALVFVLWQCAHMLMSPSSEGNGSPPFAMATTWSTVLADTNRPRFMHTSHNGCCCSFTLRSRNHAEVL
jgi:hypothetical protein